MEQVNFDKFKKLLRNEGHFVTKARLRLYAYLYHYPAITIKDLIVLAKKNDQSTIYRNIGLFEKLGIITRLRLGWHTKIELSDLFQKHHHHITCVRCGDVRATHDDKDLDATILEITNNYGYEMVEHHVEIRGICTKCTGT